mmetsp:Transcript_5817/g.18942  ORF Transcript_5817/g.18942 Transcript_5817/m.18942 type:complete len:220 (-) Transcript_5817:29-688(-)
MEMSNYGDAACRSTNGSSSSAEEESASSSLAEGTARAVDGRYVARHSSSLIWMDRRVASAGLEIEGIAKKTSTKNSGRACAACRSNAPSSMATPSSSSVDGTASSSFLTTRSPAVVCGARSSGETRPPGSSRPRASSRRDEEASPRGVVCTACSHRSSSRVAAASKASWGRGTGVVLLAGLFFVFFLVRGGVFSSIARSGGRLFRNLAAFRHCAKTPWR